MYSPDNNTNDNIDIYLQSKQNGSLMNNSYMSQENIIPYNSQNQSGYPIQNIINPQIEYRPLNYINNSTNEINNDSGNEENKIYEENQINKVGAKKKEKEEIIDDDKDLFEKDKEEKKSEEGEDLSDLSEESNHEAEYKNNLLAQYEKVKRVKNKWKVNLKGCIVQKDNLEFVCGKVHGELAREW